MPSSLSAPPQPGKNKRKTLPKNDPISRARINLDTRLDRTTNQTRAQHEAVYRLFADYISDKPIYKVSKTDAVHFFDEIRDFDPHWGRSPETKQRSYADLKALYWKKGGQLEARTLQRYASHLSGVWEWCDGRDDVAGKNPFANIIRVPKGKGGSVPYVPYTVPELNRLFKSLPKQQWLWEIALVGLYSGMRANEICSLAWENVKREAGVWYFDVVAAKSSAGVRPVPVHSKLEWLLKRRSKNPKDLIWPSLKPGGKDGKHSHYYSKAFGAWRREQKLTQPGQAFHSLRKNAVKCLERSHVPQNEAAEIVGHEKIGITYRVYNPDGMTMKQRRDIVEKIKYSGLKFPEAVLIGANSHGRSRN